MQLAAPWIPHQHLVTFENSIFAQKRTLVKQLVQMPDYLLVHSLNAFNVGNCSISYKSIALTVLMISCLLQSEYRLVQRFSIRPSWELLL